MKSPHFFFNKRVLLWRYKISQEDIIKAEENALVSLYTVSKSTKDQDRLDNLRCQRFTEKVLKSLKVVERQTLPPTPAAAKFHSLRMYFQVNEWKANSLDLDPKEWGWKEKDGQLLPIPTARTGLSYRSDPLQW